MATSIVNSDMHSTFQTFLAIRYLRGAEGRSEGRRFLRLVTRIAIGGVAVGVTTLILALAVVRGFSEEITRKIVGFGAHVQVESLRDAPLNDAPVLLAEILAEPGVVSATEVVQEFVLLRSSRSRIDGVSLWGTAEVPPYIATAMTDGEASVENGVVIGAALARTLDVETGGTVTAFSVPASGTTRPPRVAQFTVAGIYETSLADFDAVYVFGDMDAVRHLVQYAPDQVTRIDIRMDERGDFDEMANRLDAKLAFPAMARPISEIYRSLFAWVGLQESIIPLILSIIVFVAAVNVIGTLLMVILEKTPDIGVLASMGAKGSALTGIFMRVGFGIGLSGALIGCGLALILAWLQTTFGIIPLPADAYYMKEAPIDLQFVDFVLVFLTTLALCTAAAFIPARYASRIGPLRAVRTR